MVGGDDNDIYVVADAGDLVVEVAGEGTDRVDASISYTLGTDVENLNLTGTAATARAMRPTTRSTATQATTNCSAAVAMTSSTVELASISSMAALATTR